MQSQNRLQKEKDVSISALKILACIFVVILHVIENGEGKSISQLCIFLLGTFGVPLFFMVNGYLLYNHEFSLKYIGSKILRIIKFIALWGVTVGILQSLIKREFLVLDTVLGVITCKGKLFHLWFLIGLSFIYIGILVINQILGGGKSLQNKMNRNTFILIVFFLTAIFVVSVILAVNKLPEIGEYIPLSVRLITNSSYFFMGMLLHKYFEKIKKINSLVLLITIAIGYISICLLSVYLKRYSASTFYDSIFLLAGCCSLFLFLFKIKNVIIKYSSYINKISLLTIGIWVLHPFVRDVLRKLCSFTGIEFSLPIRLIALPIVILICALITFIGKKIKIINRYFVF